MKKGIFIERIGRKESLKSLSLEKNNHQSYKNIFLNANQRCDSICEANILNLEI